MIENREMAEFARNLWENYIKFRNKEADESNVSFYKAKVTANNNDGRLTVQRPFDSQAVSILCPSYMSEIAVGEQVLVLRFGDGNNLANHYIIDNAARTMMASAIATGSSITFPISIANGGTGATTLAEAKTALEIPTQNVYVGTKAYWNAKEPYVSEEDVVYVYSDYETNGDGDLVPAFKVGDGLAYLIDLPFSDDLSATHRADTDIHITAAERELWNDKVNCYLNPSDQEELIFTRS